MSEAKNKMDIDVMLHTVKAIIDEMMKMKSQIAEVERRMYELDRKLRNGS